MDEIINIFFVGVSYSALLFLISIGLSIMFGLMHFVNLASGSLYMLGAYVGITIGRHGGGWWGAVIGAGLAVGIVGLLLEAGLLRRLHGKLYEQVLVTMGVAYCLQDLSHWIWGAEPLALALPDSMQGSVLIAGASVPVYRLVLTVTGILMAAAVWWGMERTRLGALIRAGVDDMEMLTALGVDARRIFRWVFVLAGFLAGLSGALGAPVTGVAPVTGFDMLLLALVVVVVGGLGSVGGAMVGSLAVGIVDTAVKTYLPQASFFVVYVLMALVLIIRPHGLVGRAITE